MRNINLEAAVWNLFTSQEFFEATARECDDMVAWFGGKAISRQVASFGRNNQIFDKFQELADDFRRGAELARLGDYKLVRDTANSVRGHARGMLEQPLHAWMTEAQYQEFTDTRMGRLLTHARQITRVLHNGLVGADIYFDPDPKRADRRNDDDGFPGDEIAKVYESNIRSYGKTISWELPDPLPEYVIDTKIACRTGDEVPWTGVWYPGTGLENHSLTFAIKGARMQAAYRVTKTKEEVRAEGVLCPYPETVIVATTWNPFIPSSSPTGAGNDLWAKAGQSCPKAGLWQPTDPGVLPRAYQAGEPMANLGSTYGFTVWKWIAGR